MKSTWRKSRDKTLKISRNKIELLSWNKKSFSPFFKRLSLKQRWRWESDFNPLSAKFTKWPNTLKQFVGNLPTNCLRVFDHFVGLAFQGLMDNFIFCAMQSTFPITESHFFKWVLTFCSEEDNCFCTECLFSMENPVNSKFWYRPNFV